MQVKILTYMLDNIFVPTLPKTSRARTHTHTHIDFPEQTNDFLEGDLYTMLNFSHSSRFTGTNPHILFMYHHKNELAIVSRTLYEMRLIMLDNLLFSSLFICSCIYEHMKSGN